MGTGSQATTARSADDAPTIRRAPHAYSAGSTSATRRHISRRVVAVLTCPGADPVRRSSA
jgi:hypothetical protein